jgi:LDH2 family malate/lactate/ureidoglycolate dehydrogenase
MPDHDRYAAQPLQQWATRTLAACGVRADSAEQTAAVLVRTNLRGIDTHGLSRLPGYAEKLRRGEMRAQPRIDIGTRAGMLLVDGDGGLGQVVAARAVAAAVAATELVALAACAIRDSGHLGALGLFVLQAAEQGRVAWLVQSTPPIMAMAGATRAVVGNNPQAFAAPVAGGPPLVFDMASSVAARGHVLQAARDGQPIPAGWAYGPDGEPTTDAATALRGFMQPAAGHKGMGLAIVVECLAAGLAGWPAAESGASSAPVGGSAAGASAFLLVVNPALLCGSAVFEAGLQAWLQRFLAGAGAQARYPGQRQAQSEAERTRDGIPLPPSVLRELVELGAAVGCPFDLQPWR